MASNTINITKLVEGAKDVYFHVYIQSDQSGAEENNTVLVDPSTDLNPPMPIGSPAFSIIEVWYEFSPNTLIRLSFEGAPNMPACIIKDGDDVYHCFDRFGGIKDRSDNSTGRLLMSTVGFNDQLPHEGFFVIRLRKD